MSKAVLLSIHPEWCEKILNGQKTIEVRKTRPKIDTPFKCYIYCTKDGRPLVYGDVACAGGWCEKYTQTYGIGKAEADRIWGCLNGKVIGEFVCDKIYNCDADSDGLFDKDTLNHLPGSCMDWGQIFIYTKGILPLYGWHISDLIIYDKPKVLGEFLRQDNCTYYHDGGARDYGTCTFPFKCNKKRFCQSEPITRPPQSWCYVEEV